VIITPCGTRRSRGIGKCGIVVLILVVVLFTMDVITNGTLIRRGGSSLHAK
jgi:hypothetical protein